MANFCSNCGNEVAEDSKFCSKCGAELNSNYTNNININIINNYPKVSNRSILTAILLSFITCGLYGIYWFVMITDDVNTVSDDNSTSGGMALLLALITCGLYTIYWSYKMGKNLYEAGVKYNKKISDNSIFYLVFSLLGLGIVNYCLIQNDLNHFSN